MELKTTTMKQTEREYEAMANALLASFEYQYSDINEHVAPAYRVKISESGLSAKFECWYIDEDGKEDKHHFTVMKNDSISKLISYIEDNYHSLMQIEPNN